MPRDDTLLSTPRAADELEISPDQFRRLAKKAGIQPAGWYQNPHYRFGSQCPLWRPEDLKALRPETRRLAEARHRRALAAEANFKERQERIRQEFVRRYLSWRNALPDAAELLFQLNRYAKYRSCDILQRDKIYALKTGLLNCFIARAVARALANTFAGVGQKNAGIATGRA